MKKPGFLTDSLVSLVFSFFGVPFGFWMAQQGSIYVFVAGQGIPSLANGAATAADWMSAASFISMAARTLHSTETRFFRKTGFLNFSGKRRSLLVAAPVERAGMPVRATRAVRFGAIAPFN